MVSDFSLMDAIESGIVKIPRIPVDDDAAGKQLVYLHLWDNIQPPLPKRGQRERDTAAGLGAARDARRRAAQPVPQLQQNYARYEASLAALGEPPPVLIVVCPNTVVSKLVFDWIAGREVELPTATTPLVPGNLPLLSNVEDGSLDHPAAHDPRRLRAARVGRAARADSGRRPRGRSRRSSRPTGCATPAPTSTSSPTPTCCARR